MSFGNLAAGFCNSFAPSGYGSNPAGTGSCKARSNICLVVKPSGKWFLSRMFRTMRTPSARAEERWRRNGLAMADDVAAKNDGKDLFHC